MKIKIDKTIKYNGVTYKIGDVINVEMNVIDEFIKDGFEIEYLERTVQKPIPVVISKKEKKNLKPIIEEEVIEDIEDVKE